MKVLKDFLIAICLLIAIFFVFIKFYKPEPQIQILNRDVVRTDTLVIVDYLTPDPVYIEREVIVRDTIYISRDGDTTTTEVATLDTAFATGDRLSILYYIAPSIFDIEFEGARDSIRTVTVTKEINTYVDTSAWWDNYKLGAMSGVVATALLTFLVK